MHDKKKNQLIKTDPELMQMLALVDKDTKLVILTVFLKLQKLRHGRFLFFFWIQIRLLELKSTMSEVKKKMH